MKKDKTLAIRGTNYKLIFSDHKTHNELKECVGICDYYKKLILVDDKRAGITKNCVLRHEILHAYFAECGLSEYCVDETLIDFLAMQVADIVKILKNANCLKE